MHLLVVAQTQSNICCL